MSKLYKKDYIKIASILNYALKYSNDKIECINYIISELSHYLQSTNNKFDKDVFVNAILK